MGWLDCNPDELFLPTRFTVRDLPYYTPGPVENFLIGMSHITPDFVMRALDGPLSTSFVARPMQVPCNSYPFNPSHVCCVTVSQTVADMFLHKYSVNGTSAPGKTTGAYAAPFSLHSLARLALDGSLCNLAPGMHVV